jgi:DNA-binding Lrp family transcriptional regulator
MLSLTLNEKKIIKLLLHKGSMSNTEMCSKLNISKQAVGKIRKRLEEKEVITGYSVTLDLKSLGITILGLIKLTLERGASNNYDEVRKWIDNKSEVIRAHFTLAHKPVIMVVCGFDNIGSLNSFVRELSHNEYLNVEEILISQPNDTIKDSYSDLINTTFRNYN